MTKFTFVAAILTLLSSVAFCDIGADKTSTYRVRVPATANSCASEASALAGRFSAATGLTVTRAECLGVVKMNADGQSYDLYSLALTYSGYVQPYTALFGSSMFEVPADTTGTYASYGECVRDMAKQSQNYRNFAGLDIVSASCLPGQADLEPTYVLHIDGFGKPLNRLFVFQQPFMAIRDRGFDSDAESMIAQGGGTIVRSVTDKIFYYAESAVQVRRDVLGNFQNKADCDAQLTDVRAMYTTLKVSASVKCLAFQGGNSLEAVSLDALLENDLGLNSVHYFSLQECLSDRARILEASIGSRFARTPVGAVCTSDDSGSGFLMEIFLR